MFVEHNVVTHETDSLVVDQQEFKGSGGTYAIQTYFEEYITVQHVL